jgi:hypothetical protein
MSVKSVSVNLRDLAAGAVFIAIGLFFALNSLAYLNFGEAVSMGPGYFPTVLGFVLAGFGVFIGATSIGKANVPFGAVSIRGTLLIMASILFFAFSVRGLGMAPSLGISVYLSAISSGRMTIPGALVVSAALTVFCVAVFIYALGLPYPVIGPWILDR